MLRVDHHGSGWIGSIAAAGVRYPWRYQKAIASDVSPYSLFHVLSGSNFVMPRAMATVFGPRSFSYTTPS